MKNILRHNKLHTSKSTWNNTSNPHLKVTKILDIVVILDVLLSAEFSQGIHITICALIPSEYIMFRYDNNLFSIPNLQCQNNEALLSHHKKYGDQFHDLLNWKWIYLSILAKLFLEDTKGTRATHIMGH